MHKLLTVMLFTITVSTFGQSAKKQFPSTWKSLSAIQAHWISLQRDSSGYLIYKPCNGSIPQIYIDSGFVTVYWQLDAPTKYSINKFTRLSGNKSFYINASDGQENREFTVEIKDAKRKLVLWTFGEFKWVMTPLEFKKNFRQIGNPCLTEMKPEKQFLPIEF